MSSRGKKKTTMAKLTRESRLRERRVEKQARKEARRSAPPVDPTTELDHDEFSESAEGPVAEAPLADAVPGTPA
jgi:hypothetical protein